MAAQLYTIGDLIDHLCAAVDEARAKAASTSWASRVEDAYDWLLMQEAVEFDADKHELTYPSESGVTYKSNGQCRDVATGEPCKAWGRGNPCKHRCAARLCRRATERLRAEQDQDAARDRGAEAEVLPLGSRLAFARAHAAVMELYS